MDEKSSGTRRGRSSRPPRTPVLIAALALITSCASEAGQLPGELADDEEERGTTTTVTATDSGRDDDAREDTSEGPWTVHWGDPGRRRDYQGPPPTLAAEEWSVELADVVTSPPLPHPDGYLYLGDLSGHLVAVDARTGEVAGSVPYSDGSPLLIGAAGPDRILMSSAGVLTMIDADGREVWAAQAGGGEPLVVDDRVLVSAGLGDGRVYGLFASKLGARG